MITNKSTRILRRAVGWLTLWDGYAKEDIKHGTRDNRDSDAAQNIWRMAKQELVKLECYDIPSNFSKVVESQDFIYFADIEYGDDDTIMLDHKGQLVSNNYFAQTGLIDDLIEHKDTWILPEIKESIEELRENHKEEDRPVKLTVARYMELIEGKR